MTCSRCGRSDCDATCAPAPVPQAEQPRKGRLGPSDTLPDVEDEEDEEEDLFDADESDEITLA